MRNNNKNTFWLGTAQFEWGGNCPVDFESTVTLVLNLRQFKVLASKWKFLRYANDKDGFLDVLDDSYPARAV